MVAQANGNVPIIGEGGGHVTRKTFNHAVDALTQNMNNQQRTIEHLVGKMNELVASNNGLLARMQKIEREAAAKPVSEAA